MFPDILHFPSTPHPRRPPLPSSHTCLQDKTPSVGCYSLPPHLSPLPHHRPTPQTWRVERREVGHLTPTPRGGWSRDWDLLPSAANSDHCVCPPEDHACSRNWSLLSKFTRHHHEGRLNLDGKWWLAYSCLLSRAQLSLRPCPLTSSCHVTWETDLSPEDLWEGFPPKETWVVFWMLPRVRVHKVVQL